MTQQTQPITDPARLLTTSHISSYNISRYRPDINCAGHLRQGLDPEERRRVVDNLLRVLPFYDFDAIAFTGLSGALIAPTVAMMLNKTVLAVRKGEACHSSQRVEGDFNARRYIILDDFISSGSTVRKILEEIRIEVPRAQCIGVIEYAFVYAESNWKDVVQPPPAHGQGWSLLR